VAEGAPLLREYVGKTCIEGSNPSDSANSKSEKPLSRGFSFFRFPFSLPFSSPIFFSDFTSYFMFRPPP
jgi:hypothetical protein